MDILAELEKRGLEVMYETRWEGEAPNIKEVKVESQIRGLRFPLTDEEWCDLCMREGQFYVGGCCGQTSAVQDIFMEIFRDSGHADAHEILNLMRASSKHGGFEEYSLEWTGDLEKRVREWETLNPIEKIGICCQATKEKLKPLWLKIPHEKRKAESEEWCEILEDGLQLLRFRDLMQRDTDEGQRHANREVLLARILPACKKVLEAAIPAMSKSFGGFAIVKKGTPEILADGWGLCIYADEEKAKAIIALWEKNANDDERKLLEKIEIRPVTVDSESGIKMKLEVME